MPSAPQSPLTGLTVMPQQGQQQDQGQAAAAAAQAAAAQAAAAAQYQVYEPQLQFAQSKCLGRRSICRVRMFTIELV